MSATVQSVLAKLSVCRTHVMGGRKYQCDDCGEISFRYNSCGDRHCPGCSGAKRVDFNDKASKLLLNGVTYYQVVCTLPGELSELALANRYELADLLVSSAWRSVSRNIKQEQGYDPAAISVLHTWNQKLQAHWHVHLLVPGEGPSIDGSTWTAAKPPPGVRNSDGYYLIDAERLKASFRKQAIAKLKRLRSAGKLKLGGKFESLRDDDNWDAFIKNLESKTWVAYIQPPPTPTSGANEVVNYLTRYLTGGPISNYRITEADENKVTFMARDGKVIGGESQQIPITLAIEEFTNRWCLHIQPEQLTKTRYFGGWSNNRCGGYMNRCEELLSELGQIEEPGLIDESEQQDSMTLPESSDTEKPSHRCNRCESDSLTLLSETPKPSWREILWRESQTCPSWYAELQAADHHRFWGDQFGEGYSAWCQETRVEGAKKPSLDRPPAQQLFLPGLTPHLGYEIQSF